MNLKEAKKQAQIKYRQKVLDHCEHVLKVSLSAISHGDKPNPFPIGTKNIYEFAKQGKDISPKQIEKLEDWFGEFEKLKTD
jgi:hypothetical protein